MMSAPGTREAASMGSLPAPDGARLVKAGDPEETIGRSELTIRILASMNLALATSDDGLRDRGLLREDARGEVGYCEVPSARMHSTLPAANAPRGADPCIWMIERGQLVVEQGSGVPARYGAGSMLLGDLAQPLRGRWERARLIYVRPARQRLIEVLGRAPGQRVRAVESIEHLGLAPFLGVQLGMLASHGAALMSSEHETVLGGIFRTSEALLRAMFAGTHERDTDPGADRLQAVHRYIQRNLHRHDLSVEDIARGTSISRSQLYRLFASQDLSVHGTLREERLVKSLGYLSKPESDGLSIGAIAYACGFSDQAVFSKLFRQRFRMTPREARAAARSASPG